MESEVATRDPATQTFFTMEEAAACIEQLLLRAEAGEKISIMRDGRVVVELAQGPERRPDPEEARKGAERFWEELEEIKSSSPPTKVTREEILAWRHAGYEQ